MKNIVSFVLIVLMLLSLTPFSVLADSVILSEAPAESKDLSPEEEPVSLPPIAENMGLSGTCGQNVIWTLDNAGTFTISGAGDMFAYESENDLFWSIRKSNIREQYLVEEQKIKHSQRGGGRRRDERRRLFLSGLPEFDVRCPGGQCQVHRQLRLFRLLQPQRFFYERRDQKHRRLRILRLLQSS